MTRFWMRGVIASWVACVGVILLAVGIGYTFTLVDNELVFTAYLASGNNGDVYNIYRMDITHGLIHRLAAKIDNGGQFDLSPDGKQIVFVRYVDHQPSIYAMDFQGSHRRRLSALGTFEYNPMWSPDGQSIVFLDAPLTSLPDLYMKELESGKITRLTDDQKNETTSGWSPDGNHIVFAADRITTNNADIFTLDVSTKEIHLLVATPVNDTNPSWSPDGRYLLYFKDDIKRPELSMMLYDIINDKTTMLYRDAFFDGDTPNWSADGRYIVYSAFNSYDSSSLYRLDVPACLQQPKTCYPERLTYANTFFINPRWRPQSS